MMSKKLNFISYAYAIGAILVVLGHSTPTGTSDMPVIIDKIRTFIYCFHMPLFFFIAGFLFKYTSGNKTKPYMAFMKNKSIKFLVPYFVLSAVGIIPKILLSSLVDDKVSFNFYYVFEAIFNPRLNVWGHFWFLPTLLIIFSLSYLILKSYRNRLLFSVVFALSLVLSVFLENTGSKILGYFEGKTFSIYIISWPCQAAVEVLLNRIMHMHWYVTMPAMFLAGIGVPLLFLWIYGKFKHHPKFINLIFGVN